MVLNKKNGIDENLQEILDFMSKATVNDNISWNKFKEKATEILKKIKTTQQKVQENEMKTITSVKTKFSQANRIKELKDIQLLKAYLIQGYSFIQEFGAFIKKEKIEYLILFADSEANGGQKIGKYSLAELIPTLNIAVVNNGGDFSLQINNLEELAKLKNQENYLEWKINNAEEKILSLFNTLLTKRRNAVREKRLKTETPEKKTIREEKNRQISGYEIGQEGIAFELAVNRMAEAIRNGSPPNLEVEKFKADNQAFYKAGDIEQKEIDTLLDGLVKTSLELKVVRSKTKSGYSMGARLSGSKTIQKALEDVIKILNNSSLTKEEIFNQLKIFYGKKQDEVEAEFTKQSDNIAIKNADNIILRKNSQI